MASEVTPRKAPSRREPLVCALPKIRLLFLTGTAFEDTKEAFLSHHFIYGNTYKIRNIREKKDIGITKLSFPFRHGLGADSEKFSKLTLRKPVMLAVIQYAFAYTDFVFHFTRLYIS